MLKDLTSDSTGLTGFEQFASYADLTPFASASNEQIAQSTYKKTEKEYLKTVSKETKKTYTTAKNNAVASEKLAAKSTSENTKAQKAVAKNETSLGYTVAQYVAKNSSADELAAASKSYTSESLAKIQVTTDTLKATAITAKANAESALETATQARANFDSVVASTNDEELKTAYKNTKSTTTATTYASKNTYVQEIAKAQEERQSELAKLNTLSKLQTQANMITQQYEEAEYDYNTTNENNYTATDISQLKADSELAQAAVSSKITEELGSTSISEAKQSVKSVYKDALAENKAEFVISSVSDTATADYLKSVTEDSKGTDKLSSLKDAIAVINDNAKTAVKNKDGEYTQEYIDNAVQTAKEVNNLLKITKAMSDDAFYAAEWEDEEKLNSVYEWGTYVSTSGEELLDLSELELDDVTLSFTENNWDEVWDSFTNFLGDLGDTVADQIGDVISDTASNIVDMFVQSLTSVTLVTGTVSQGVSEISSSYINNCLAGFKLQTNGDSISQISLAEASSSPVTYYDASTSLAGGMKSFLDEYAEYLIDPSQSSFIPSLKPDTENGKVGKKSRLVRNTEKTTDEAGNTTTKTTIGPKTTAFVEVSSCNYRTPKDTTKHYHEYNKDSKNYVEKTEALTNYDSNDYFNERAQYASSIELLPRQIPALSTAETPTRSAIASLMRTYNVLGQHLYMLYVKNFTKDSDSSKDFWNTYLVKGITLPGFSKSTGGDMYGTSIFNAIAQQSATLQSSANLKIICDRQMQVYASLLHNSGQGIITTSDDLDTFDSELSSYLSTLDYEKLYDLSTLTTQENWKSFDNTETECCAYIQILDNRFLNKEFYMEEYDYDANTSVSKKPGIYSYVSKSFDKDKKLDPEVTYEDLPCIKLENFAVRNVDASFDFTASTTAKLLELDTLVTWSRMRIVQTRNSDDLASTFLTSKAVRTVKEPD